MSLADPVHTLADLERQSFPGTVLAVLGHPIQHSLSPAMHNAALAEMARTNREFTSWHYYRFEVHPDDLSGALDLFRARGFRGLNLTVPHKVIAFAHLKPAAPAVRMIGAVNTLLRKAPGSWEGYNTDGYGLAMGVREDLGITLEDMPIILLGAGGAARGAGVECLQRHCASLWVANRTCAHLDALLDVLRPLAGEVPLHGFDPQAPPAGLPAGALVINATSAGLRPDDPMPIDLKCLPRPAGVYDMIYNPPAPLLLRQATALGLRCANGLSMLAHQGAKSLEIWSGASAGSTAPTMLRAARAALAPS